MLEKIRGEIEMIDKKRNYKSKEVIEISIKEVIVMVVVIVIFIIYGLIRSNQFLDLKQHSIPLSEGETLIQQCVEWENVSIYNSTEESIYLNVTNRIQLLEMDWNENYCYLNSNRGPINGKINKINNKLIPQGYCDYIKEELDKAYELYLLLNNNISIINKQICTKYANYTCAEDGWEEIKVNETCWKEPALREPTLRVCAYDKQKICTHKIYETRIK